MDFRWRPAATQRTAHVHDAVTSWAREQGRIAFLALGSAHVSVDPKAGTTVFERAQSFSQRLLERAADGHDLTDGFHPGGKRVIRILELLERETRRLDDAVVDGRLEAGGRHARDVVLDFGQRVADGKAGGDFGNRETRCLRRERRRARNARVHLDDDHAPVIWVDGELYVRTARLDAYAFEDGQRCRAHALVLDIGKRLSRCDCDRVARMHAHGIEVFDGAHDDAVARAVAHDLHLELFPTLDAFFHEHFADRRQLDAL